MVKIKLHPYKSFKFASRCKPKTIEEADKQIRSYGAEDIHIIRNATMNFNNDWAVTATEMLNTLYGIQPVTLSIINSV